MAESSTSELDNDVDEQPRPPLVSPLVTNAIAIVVTLVWAASFIADLVSAAYSPPAQIHAAMLAVVGAVFGIQVVRRDK